MTDKNWKVRSEGLQKVTEILKEAKFVTANIGGLPEAIKARLSESNKNLVSVLLGDCASEHVDCWIPTSVILYPQPSYIQNHNVNNNRSCERSKHS